MKRPSFARVLGLSLTASVGALAVCAAPPWAGPTPDCVDGLGTGTTECGTNSTTGAAGNTDSTAIGQNSVATADEATAVGEGAVADSFGGTALG